MAEQITGGLGLNEKDAAVFYTAYQLKETLGEPKPPYHYHTIPIVDVDKETNVLQTILNDRKLRNPKERRPIMFTADKIDPNGSITSSGLNDPAYADLAGRALREGRATLVFDNTITNSDSYRPASDEQRYPEVDEMNLESLCAIITLPQDMDQVKQLVAGSDVSVYVVSQAEWEAYAYSG